MVDANAVSVGDFLEADADAPLRAGVYRVVGTPEGALVCLRVGDENGRREATGEVVRVAVADASALEPASEPRSAAVDALANVLQGPYWVLRSLLPF